MLPTVSKILYCTDLSANANRSMQYAVYLAKVTGAEIHILHVLGRLSNDAVVALQAYLDEAQTPKKIARNRLSKTKDELERQQDTFWQELPEQDQALRSKIVGIHAIESYPAEEILRKVNEWQCDLIVMGSHERGFVNTFLGSVVKSVLRRTNVPTLVVPPSEEPPR